MHPTPPLLCWLSEAPVPDFLRPWVSVNHGWAGTCDDASLRVWASATVPARCWVVDGVDPGAWRAGVAALREAGWLDAHPWVLYLPDTATATAEALGAWALGATDVLHAQESPQMGLARLQACAVRRCSPSDTAAQLQRLQAELQALRASVDNIPAPIFVKNAAGVYIDCNQSFLAYLGRSREQVVGKTVYDVAPPELARVYEAADQQLLAEGGRQIYDAQVRWADGDLRDVTFYKAVFHDTTGAPAGQAGAIFDITERRRLERGLRTLAETDVLTGLSNRRSFIELAEQHLREASSVDQATLVLMLFDLDHFKQVNDHHGHAAGDAMLRHVSQLVARQLRADDLLARIGGDEFAIVLQGATDVQAVADRLPALVAQTPLSPDDGGLACTISLGVAVVNPAWHTVDSALNQADLALYEAKRQGRNRAVVLDSSRTLPGRD